MVTIFIYTLTNPLNNQVFYVGRSVSKLETRLSGHLNDAKNGTKSKKVSIIQSIFKAGLLPIIEEVERFDCSGRRDEIYTNHMEYYWITQFYAWGFDLANVHGIFCDYRTVILIHWDKKDIERIKIQNKKFDLERHLRWLNLQELPEYAISWFAKKVWKKEHLKNIEEVKRVILVLEEMEANLAPSFV